MNDTRLICGAMSGTSADGVDAVLVSITGRGMAMTATPVAHAYVGFADDLRTQILDVRGRGEVRLADLAAIGRRVTLAHVDACRAAFAKANVAATDVAAIAVHGQTLWHGPPDTIQYFDPSLLAVHTGCAVVSDFRRADLAVGGQGAPLVPFADWILFRHPEKSRVILNVGGIANVTYLKAGGTIDDVIAFDTGPGNCISDWLMRTHPQAGRAYDAGGQLALRGTASQRICWEFVDHPYVNAAPPKSTDGPAMIALYESTLAFDPAERDRPLEDRLATAATVVSWCVSASLAYDLEQPLFPDEVFVAGGGAENAAIMRQLAHEFSADAWAPGSEIRQVLERRPGRRVPVRRLEELGMDGAAREAIAFALLGAATLDGEPSNVPSATGASRRVVLGSITPKP